MKFLHVCLMLLTVNLFICSMSAMERSTYLDNNDGDTQTLKPRMEYDKSRVAYKFSDADEITHLTIKFREGTGVRYIGKHFIIDEKKYSLLKTDYESIFSELQLLDTYFR